LKIVFILLTFLTILFGKNYELQLYETIFSQLFNSKKIKVFVDENRGRFLESKIIILTDDCKKADILVLHHLYNLPLNCQDKPIFTTSYRNYLNEDVIGAFYWRKGRPQLKLKLQLLEKFNMKITKDLRKYVR